MDFQWSPCITVNTIELYCQLSNKNFVGNNRQDAILGRDTAIQKENIYD